MFAMMAGLSEEEIASSRVLTSEDERRLAAIQFAAALVRARGAVDDAAFAAVRRIGFTDREIAEIIGHVALNLMTNYFNQAVQTVIDFPKVRTALHDGI
jgi:alkylhydroperoxidase family enzyme